MEPTRNVEAFATNDEPDLCDDNRLFRRLLFTSIEQANKQD